MDHVFKINETLREAEDKGGWARFAVWCLGESLSGDKELDKLIMELYLANEAVHRQANKLALRFDLEVFDGE